MCPHSTLTSHMTTPTTDLTSSLAEEAAALLAINQRRRGHAEATFVLVAIASLAVIATSIAVGRPAVFLPLPPIALLLMSLAFQQYADVTVIGVARRKVERSVNAAVGGEALVYETQIADVRKRLPLVRGVRLLQLVAWVGVVVGVVVGAVIASNEEWWAVVVYAIATLAASASCLVSLRDMRQAEAVAAVAFDVPAARSATS